jgi:hypothetical protein
LRYAAACFAPMLILSSPSHAQQGEELPGASRPGGTSGLEIITGVEFQQLELSDGQELEKITVPLTARLTAGRVRLSAQLPYVRVSGPENVVPPSGPLGLPILLDPAGPAEVRTREGVGDARVGLAYDLGIPGMSASLNAGAKVPTASVDEGLGTGKADYWVGADVAASLGAVTPFAGISYTKAGDPEGFELRDTLSGQAGAALRLGQSASAHLGFSYSESASDFTQDEKRVFGGLNTALSNRLALGVYGSAGVAGPTDIGAGVSLGIGFK